MYRQSTTKLFTSNLEHQKLSKNELKEVIVHIEKPFVMNPLFKNLKSRTFIADNKGNWE